MQEERTCGSCGDTDKFAMGMCGCGAAQPYTVEELEPIMERLKVTPDVVMEDGDYSPEKDLEDAVRDYKWLEDQVGSAADGVFAAVYEARRWGPR